MNVPEECFLLLAGIPAVGKSSFGRYLAREHAFAHYDLECHPRGWPHPEQKRLWDSSRKAFIAKLKTLHKRVALDWGFPANVVLWVDELLAEGVQLIWFEADIAKARELFQQRGGLPVASFNDQVLGIQSAGLPNSLSCVRVSALTDAGTLRDAPEILLEIFGG